MTANEVAKCVVLKYGSRFGVRRNFVCVQNVSFGFSLPWEADLFICNNSGYLTEIEIKITLSDWKKDIEKFQHLKQNYKTILKYFYYAAPMELAKRYEEVELAEGAGVIGVEITNSGNYDFRILKPAQKLMGKKINEAQKLTLARLGSIKAWKT